MRTPGIRAGAALLLLAVACSGQDAAAEHRVDRALKACLEKAATTADMVGCTRQAIESWNKELQRSVVELSAGLGAEAAKDLQAAQDSWGKFHKSDQALRASIYGRLSGSMFAIMREDDELELLKWRALQLQKYIDLLKESGR